MAMLKAHDVRVRDVGILVDLVRIMGRDATLGRERELRDDIHNFLLLVAVGFLALLTLSRR